MEEAFASYDLGAYRRYTFPQELDKAVHMLEGIVKGIAIDGAVNAEEIGLLRVWCDHHRAAASKHPFSELIPMLDGFIADGILDGEERADILWFCNRFTTENAYFDVVTSDIQRLHGLLVGIAADDMITREELDRLSGWVQEHENLKGAWPYDEIDAVLVSVLADGRIDEAEHRFLLRFFTEFLATCPHLLLESEFDEDLIRHGVCAMCPEILFMQRVFCFTGKSSKASRAELARLVTRLGGQASPSLRRTVDYLVVGGEGNRAWAFSCYGRKVEEAVSLRKEGAPIQIVHEFDFWDAVEDCQ